MKFSVMVCDDNEGVCQEIQDALQQYIERNELAVELFYSGEELYKTLESGSRADLIFLDIELGMMNGIQTGGKIRDILMDEDVSIVFISGKTEYAMELFGVRPMDFIVKPFSAEDITGAVEKAMYLAGRKQKSFVFRSGQETCSTAFSDIIFFESSSKKIIMHTACGICEFYDKLPCIEEMLDGSFLRTHQSYLVNMRFIEAYGAEELKLKNGEKIPVSRKYRSSVREAVKRNWRYM